MIRINIEEFKNIRRKISDIRCLSLPGYTRGMLFTVLSQKKVDSVKRWYPKAVERLDEIYEFWSREKKLPKWMKLTPIMRVRLLLKSMNLTKAEINRILNDPERVHNLDSNCHPEEIEKLIWRAIYTDYVYSPLAARHQKARGKLGEKIICDWLSSRGIDFYTEKDLRKKFSKTPDFFFEEPVRLNGIETRWIESKALFGDPKTHWIYSRKQFSVYREMFGKGYIVYWFGYVNEIKDDDGILETDVFCSPLKNALNDMIVYSTGGNPKKVAGLVEKLKTYVVDIGCDLEPYVEDCVYLEVESGIKTKEFLECVGRIIDCYSNGRVLIADSNRDWKSSIRKDIGWILRNMGFVVVHV